MTAKFHSRSTGSSLRRRLLPQLALVVASATVYAQTPAPAPSAGSVPATRGTAPAPAATGTAPAPATGVVAPPGFLIGPEDVLSIVYWRDREMTTDVVVRPDGKISLPLLNEIQAAGLTPGELRDRITEQSKRYLEEPNLTVVLKQINSRKVFITGEINKPGPYALTAPTTVLQLIALAGGLKEFAKSDKIVIVRIENGRTTAYSFNYKQVTSRKRLQQNIELKPGDTVVIPG
jgi:polysaccharide biosynthesis/export protein